MKPKLKQAAPPNMPRKKPEPSDKPKYVYIPKSKRPKDPRFFNVDARENWLV